MSSRIASIAERIRILEEELENEIASRRADLRFSIHERTIRFEEEAKRRHRALRSRLSGYVFGAHPLILLTAPVIYAVLLPLLLLDLFASAYQAICFRAYGIPRVDRRRYIAFDRRHLGYLNAVEKLNCEYCSYANGIIAYVREIAARTEQFWCPIKHAIRVRDTHGRYARFFDYGDAEAYREDLEELRAALRKVEAMDSGARG